MTHGRVHRDLYDGGLNGCEMEVERVFSSNELSPPRMISTTLHWGFRNQMLVKHNTEESITKSSSEGSKRRVRERTD